MKGLTLLPVPALNRVHIERSGVVKIYGEMLFYGLFPDFGQGFRFLLGAVGTTSFLVLSPEGGELTSAILRTKRYCAGQDGQQPGH